MIFVKSVWILFRKELSDYFTSEIVYILSGLFSLIVGWLFYNYLLGAKNHTTLGLAGSVLTPLFGNINFLFLFLVPLITMNTFSQEKKQSTLELLLRSQLGNLSIIVAKFLASFTVALFLLSFTLVFVLILAISGYHEWGLVASGYLGLCLTTMCYIAVGMLASSLTKNPIVAGFLGFSIMLVLMLMVLTTQASNNYLVGLIFQYISVPLHYEGFVRGVIKSYSMIYFISFIGFFLYLTSIVLDSRRW